MDTQRRAGLLAWQWSTYDVVHRNRGNLLVHAPTQPLFVIGGVLVPVALATGAGWMALAAAPVMVVAVALQGRGHGREENPPLPFRGPFDVVLRLLAEQWITFPRYVLSGGFARAWRDTARPADETSGGGRQGGTDRASQGH